MNYFYLLTSLNKFTQFSQKMRPRHKSKILFNRQNISERFDAVHYSIYLKVTNALISSNEQGSMLEGRNCVALHIFLLTYT